MNAFLFCHSAIMKPDEVRSILNKTKAVATWISPFPYSTIVVSELTVVELAAIFRTHLGETWFVVAELEKSSCDGLLPEQCWRYISDPFGSWSAKVLAHFQQSLTASPERAALGPAASEPPHGSKKAGG
jgi:hypothetical protein